MPTTTARPERNGSSAAQFCTHRHGPLASAWTLWYREEHMSKSGLVLLGIPAGLLLIVGTVGVLFLFVH
jgi:hypothetical protein